MNVLELLYQELKDKDWTFEEKARYIFLRSCQLFSYDPRYQFCGLLGERGYELKREILDRVIDLENVTNAWVVCSSHAKYVLSILLKELLGAETLVEGSGHMYTTFSCGNETFIADATKVSDIARVKMGLSTKKYGPKDKQLNIDYAPRLKQLDKNIDYITDDYEEVLLRQRKSQLSKEQTSGCNYYLNQMQIVEKLFRKYANLPSFCDATFCLNYLCRQVLGENFYDIIDEFPLVDMSCSDNWRFTNLYTLEYPDGINYYKLEQGADGFNFGQIDEEKASYYAYNYSGMNRQRILR